MNRIMLARNQFANRLAAQAITALLVTALGGLLATAQAAPIRFATISWAQQSGTSTVDFNVQTAWRSSDFGSPVVGSTVNLGLNFNFGDGTTAAMLGTTNTVVSFSNWFMASTSFTHTYTGTEFDAGFAGFSTLPDLQNSNANKNFAISTKVRVPQGGAERSPNSTALPVLFLPLGSGTQVFNMPAVVFGGNSLRYVLDALGGDPAQPGFFSLNGFNGLLSVDTSAASVQSGLYDLRYRLESVNGNGQVQSSTSVYMLMDLICTTGSSCSNPGPPPAQDLPEPGSMALMLLGLLALVSRCRIRLL